MGGQTHLIIPPSLLTTISLSSLWLNRNQSFEKTPLLISTNCLTLPPSFYGFDTAENQHSFLIRDYWPQSGSGLSIEDAQGGLSCPLLHLLMSKDWKLHLWIRLVPSWRGMPLTKWHEAQLHICIFLLP